MSIFGDIANATSDLTLPVSSLINGDAMSSQLNDIMQGLTVDVTESHGASVLDAVTDETLRVDADNSGPYLEGSKDILDMHDVMQQLNDAMNSQHDMEMQTINNLNADNDSSDTGETYASTAGHDDTSSVAVADAPAEHADVTDIHEDASASAA